MFKFTKVVAAFSQKTALMIGLVFVSAGAYAQQPIDISRELDKLPAFKLLVDKHPEIRPQLTRLSYIRPLLLGPGGREDRHGPVNRH